MSKFTLKIQFFKTTKRYPYTGFEAHVRKTLKECVRHLSRLPVKEPHPFPKGIALEIGCVGPEKMMAINRSTRGQSRPTDILSFRFGDQRMRGQREDVTGCLMLCRVAILQKWGSEIRSQGIKAIYHRLLIHGFLHLLGFDHYRKRDARVMRHIEEFLGVATELLD